jgi:hypothetical protein
MSPRGRRNELPRLAVQDSIEWLDLLIGPGHGRCAIGTALKLEDNDPHGTGNE